MPKINPPPSCENHGWYQIMNSMFFCERCYVVIESINLLEMTLGASRSCSGTLTLAHSQGDIRHMIMQKRTINTRNIVQDIDAKIEGPYPISVVHTTEVIIFATQPTQGLRHGLSARTRHLIRSTRTNMFHLLHLPLQ